MALKHRLRLSAASKYLRQLSAIPWKIKPVLLACSIIKALPCVPK